MFSLPDGYTVLERLGDGSFGRVELIQKEEDGSLYALKILESENGISSAENEIDVLNLISSPFVVKLYDVFKGDGYCAIMMDACLGGSLRLRIASKDKETNPFMTEEILEITAQILIALKELHGLGYAHRDLSPSNILFVKEGSNRLQLIDFGVSCIVGAKSSSNSGVARRSVGTPSYMSPEMKSGKPHDQMTDMYSLGVILFEMCELRLPKDGECTSESHPSLDALLMNLLCNDPSQRATAEDCLSFPDIMDILPKFEGAQRIKLTAYDWMPAEAASDDEANLPPIDDIDDMPPIEIYESTPVTPGRLLDNHHKHWREPEFEEIQAAEKAAKVEKEKVEMILKQRKEQKILDAQKKRAQSKLSQQKWNEQKGDLAKHGVEYQKRLEQLKKQPRPGGRRLIPNSVISGSSPNSGAQSPFASCANVGLVSADEIEKVTYSLEKIMGVEKLSSCIKALDVNPLLSPSELGVTPRIFDVLSKLMRYRKDVFG